MACGCGRQGLGKLLFRSEKARPQPRENAKRGAAAGAPTHAVPRGKLGWAAATGSLAAWECVSGARVTGARQGSPGVGWRHTSCRGVGGAVGGGAADTVAHCVSKCQRRAANDMQPRMERRRRSRVSGRDGNTVLADCSEIGQEGAPPARKRP